MAIQDKNCLFLGNVLTKRHIELDWDGKKEISSFSFSFSILQKVHVLQLSKLAKSGRQAFLDKQIKGNDRSYVISSMI